MTTAAETLTIPSALGTTPPADLLPVQREATLAYRLARIFVLPLLHVLFVFQVKGRKNIPRTGNYVMIANHLNWLDSFAILASFPAEPRVHFLGDPYDLQNKKFQWNFVKAMGGFIPVNRREGSGPCLYNHVNTCLQRGGVVALYPEGHYGAEEGGLDPFKKGFAHFAIDNDVPVLPVALSGMKDLWFRKRVQVVIGEPIATQGKSVDDLIAEGHATLKALIPAPAPTPRGPKLLRKRLTNLF
jgi:1-acyl-sn-glycerol-3-phosphate acyltransferase